MKKWWMIFMIGVGCISLNVSIVQAEIDLGCGMEYFTTKAVIDDGTNGFCHTMIQSTLVVAKLNWMQGPFYAELNGGISDWNISGDLDGSGTAPTTYDLFGWGWQQKTRALVLYKIWHALALGAGYSDQAIKHYDGLTGFQYSKYRLQGYELLLNYTALDTQSVKIHLSASYSPAARMEMYQIIYFQEIDLQLCEYDTAGIGQTWKGEIKLEYRDSENWGLDLIYQFGWSAFDNPENVEHVSIKTGSLTGYFVLRF